ncbi:MAG: PepSY domain-containing protein [Campylobacteraceae bacterium]|nr:PepSY domain-containing protein [Campylobacteraceae bacterium]
MEESKSKLLKQKLFTIHISAGIVFSQILFLSLFFGIFAILLPYIKMWEKPSRHFEQINIAEINYTKMINTVLEDPNFPKNNVIINLPGHMGDNALVITHRFYKDIAFNPKTEKKLDDEDNKSHLAEFLNELHYGQPLKIIGRIIFGLVAIGGMFLVISGLMLIIKMKFTNKGKNQQSTFSRIHIKLFTWLFPPYLIIILTGAVMNVGLISSGPMAEILTKGQAKDIDSLVGKVLFPREKSIKLENKTAKMLDLNILIKKAININPDLTLKQIKLINWNDESARVEIIAYNPYKPFLNGGIFNKPSITLNAVNGELIKHKKVMDTVWSVFVAESLFFLHFLFGINIFFRILIAVLMLLCCIAISFGVMLWLEKKARKYDGKTIFYHWFGKLSLAIMIGVIPSTAALFILQWLLPFDLVDRVLWQQGIFYNIWLFTLFWAFYRINSYQASKELLFSAALLFISTPIIHFIISGFSPLRLIKEKVFNILAVDIGLFIFGFTILYISKKLPKNRDEANIFWVKNKKEIK